MAKKYRVTLTAQERSELEAMIRRGKSDARKLAHARALLLADEADGAPGRTDEDIASALWPDCRHAVVAVADAKKGERLILVTDKRDADAAPLLEHAQAIGAPEIAVPRRIIRVPQGPQYDDSYPLSQGVETETMVFANGMAFDNEHEFLVRAVRVRRAGAVARRDGIVMDADPLEAHHPAEGRAHAAPVAFAIGPLDLAVVANEPGARGRS